MHPVLLLVGDGRHPAWAPPPAVRDREAAAVAGGGGADLRSKLGEPPILESWRAPMPKCHDTQSQVLSLFLVRTSESRLLVFFFFSSCISLCSPFLFIFFFFFLFFF